MQKFSKKLVSKCIYIHILSSSTPELLELFLTQKGWDLLNAWFSDAYTSENYYLCGDLITLFSVCPMTSARLKENVEINQVNINFSPSRNSWKRHRLPLHWSLPQFHKIALFQLSHLMGRWSVASRFSVNLFLRIFLPSKCSLYSRLPSLSASWALTRIFRPKSARRRFR